VGLLADSFVVDRRDAAKVQGPWFERSGGPSQTGGTCYSQVQRRRGKLVILSAVELIDHHAPKG